MNTTDRPCQSPEPPSIRRAAESEMELVVDILAEAFADDPVLLWLSDDPSFPRFIFQIMVDLFRPEGGILVDSSGSAAALYMPFGQRTPSAVTPAIAFRSLLCFGPRFLLRGLRVDRLYNHHHYQADHVYVFAIGNRSSVRGRGYGSALMKHLLAEAGADRHPVYLENSKPRNVPFYSKFGFVAQNTFLLPAGGPPVDAMLRRPQGLGSSLQVDH